MSGVTFRGVIVSRADVLRALTMVGAALGADSIGRQESLPADAL